ncbi:hypothetical protein PI172_0065 [Prevotella intermedia]|uniref:Uncharacterized protein n=1 Tax=Prevotella intermedia TaxID=28131 RepID=A0AAD1BG13_PREIN|nr:hypothetical protein PI172_0065 [Prevotella intermedia]
MQNLRFRNAKSKLSFFNELSLQNQSNFGVFTLSKKKKINSLW